MSIPTSQPDPTAVLNQLLRILYRSLPIYLEHAKPWTDRSHQKLLTALADMAADQRMLSQRVAEAILQHGGRLEPGSFPMEFTDTHDLAVDFLLQKLVHFQRRDLEAVERCATELAEGSPWRALAEEILGNTRGHLETLETLLNPA